MLECYAASQNGLYGPNYPIDSVAIMFVFIGETITPARVAGIIG